MAMWMQHLLVLVAVGICLAVVARGALRTLRGHKSKLGSCCAKGCSETAKAQATAERVVFFPSDMLVRKR